MAEYPGALFLRRLGR